MLSFLIFAALTNHPSIYEDKTVWFDDRDGMSHHDIGIVIGGE
jgi:hypothetical protein